MSNLLPKHSAPDELSVSQLEVQSPDNGISSQMVKSASEMQYEREDMSVFFGIGMAINIVMIVSFFIWAVKQWKKHDSVKK